MSDTKRLNQIAGIFVDAYCTLNDIKRPLTDEHIKDAGVLFLDLIEAHEAQIKPPASDNDK